MQMRFLYTILFLVFGLIAIAQKQASTPQRTPEEEAAKQTEMLVRLLPNLTDLQKQHLYTIHLKYIKERQEHPCRTAAIERIKRKHEEYRKILTDIQYKTLQSTYENHSVHIHKSQSSNQVNVPIHATNY